MRSLKVYLCFLVFIIQKIHFSYSADSDSSFLRSDFESKVTELALAGRSQEAIDPVVDGINYFSPLICREKENTTLATRFVSAIFALFRIPSFHVPPNLVVPLISVQGTISRLVAGSDFLTTDSLLSDLVLHLPESLSKVFIVYNARSALNSSSYDALFDHDPYLASAWYFSWFMSENIDSVREEHALHHLRVHASYCEKLGDRLTFYPHNNMFYQAFFFPSYVTDPAYERCIKRKINEHVKRNVVPHYPVNNKPDPLSVAFVSSSWNPGTQVHLCLGGFVRSLKDHFKVTLIVLDQPWGIELADADVFSSVQHVFNLPHGDRAEMKDILDNEFAAVIFSDVGSSIPGIYMANMRLAPVQLVGHGHPISTFGANIDYFVSSAWLELEDAQERLYHETLVLLDSTATTYPSPPFSNTPRAPCDADPFVVGIVSNWYKTNYRTYNVLKQVKALVAPRPIQFWFFAGDHLYGKMAWFRFQAEIALGEGSVFVFPNLPEPEWFRLLRQCHVVLDTLPAGAITTGVAVFRVGVPMIAVEGTSFMGRYATVQYHRLGLQELVAKNDSHAASIVARVATDDAYCTDLNSRFSAADFESVVFKDGQERAQQFRVALQYLISHHREEELSATSLPPCKKTPIRVFQNQTVLVHGTLVQV